MTLPLLSAVFEKTLSTKPVDGSAPFHPMGKAPQGIIMYRPDGYMSAQLMLPERPLLASGDWFRARDEEVKRGGKPSGTSPTAALFILTRNGRP